MGHPDHNFQQRFQATASSPWIARLVRMLSIAGHRSLRKRATNKGLPTKKTISIAPSCGAWFFTKNGGATSRCIDDLTNKA